MDVNDITAVKVVGKTTMTKDVIVDDGFDEKATRSHLFN